MPLTISNVELDQHAIYKNWRKRKLDNCSIRAEGKTILFVHGGTDGSLAIKDSELQMVLPFVDMIICCYPRRVCARYEQFFPGISEKIAHRWADIPVCGTSFPQSNGKFTLIEWDYPIKRAEWNSMYDNVKEAAWNGRKL